MIAEFQIEAENRIMSLLREKGVALSERKVERKDEKFVILNTGNIKIFLYDDS